MKKIILFFILAIGFLSSGYAETVSQKKAQQLAQLFFNEAAGRIVAPPKLVYNGKKLTTSKLFTPFYVYNSTSGAFVIISADNKAFPILGFSLKDTFDPNRLGDTELALLRSYAKEIEYIRYDSEPITKTERAWIEFPNYLDNILSAQYLATDPKFSVKEAEVIIDYSYDVDDAIFSDLYTPEQWRDMIMQELSNKGSVPLVIVDGEKWLPAVVYGRQDDYFRIEMNRRNSWLMRLNATEIIPSNMVSTVKNPLDFSVDLAEEMPFNDLDEFNNEIQERELARTSVSYNTGLQLLEGPSIRRSGSGFFEISLPENINSITVYNLNGSPVRKLNYGDYNIGTIDIIDEPRGFYILNAQGESGQPYSFKVYR